MKHILAERLQHALELRNMKQIDLVNQTGIGRASICTYLSGDYLPKQKNIHLMAKVLNVSEAWLTGVDSNMERRDNMAGRVLSEDESKLLSAYAKLNFTGKSEALNRITELTELSKYI